MKNHPAPINVLLIDDEKNACTNLQNLLSEYTHQSINVSGLAHSTRDAEALIRESVPDAVFIDIDMPVENAFQFLQRIAPFTFEVIFVTAYDQYAVKAFRLNAVDYILKPIDIDELILAVERLQERISIKKIISNDNISYLDLLSQVSKKAESHKIRLKSVNYSEIIDFDDIYFVEAQGSYSRIVFAKNSITSEIIMSNPLSDYEELLPVALYYRVHKTYLINCRHVTKLISDDNNYIILHNEFTIPVSRRRILPLKKFLKSNGYFL